jgi:uncharacterized protein
MNLTRVVIDTNVLVSAFLNTVGVPGRSLRMARETSRLVFTDSTLAEVVEVLLRSKFDRYASNVDRRHFLGLLTQLDKPIAVSTSVVACRDPRDNHILEAAVNGSAELIITGDRDLLELHPFHDIKILTPADYLLK